MTKLSPKKLSTINADIRLIFGELQPETPTEYYHTKLNAIHQRHLAGHPPVESEEKGIKLKLVKSKDLPAIPKGLQKNIECLRSILNNDFPLLPAEVVREDIVTLLAKEYGQIPVNTVVIQRNTNLATLYFILENIAVDKEYKPILQTIDLPLQAPQPLTQGQAILFAGTGAKSIAATIGKELASGILGAIGGAIADAILDAIFPPETPAYFDEVYKHIAKIVHQEIQQSKIDEVSAAITNVVKKINNEYTPARKERDLTKEKDRKYLFNLLQKYDQTFLSGSGGMLGTLQQENNANAGFTVFLLGASIQLAIYQEMANVDPMNGDEKKGWKSPLKSSYGKPKTGTVAKTAKDFVVFGDKTYKAVLKARKNSITAEKYSELVNETKWGSRFPSWKRHYYVRVNDNGVATTVLKDIGQDDKNGKNPNYDAFVNNDLANYRKEKNDELIAEMNNPLETIGKWKKLIDSPIKLK